MVDGTVKWFDKKKGYGFISYNDDKDVFVHYSGFGEGLKTLDTGDSVAFEITAGEKGPKANSVTVKSHA